MAPMAHLSGQAAIVGYGDAYSSPHEPLSPMNLAVTAALRCMKDAGVPRNDIDGLLTGREPFGDYRAQWNMNFASELKLTPQFSTQVTLHSAGVNAMLKHALLAVTSGAADYVMCVQSDGGMAYADLPRVVSLLDAQPEFELPYGPSMKPRIIRKARSRSKTLWARERSRPRCGSGCARLHVAPGLRGPSW